MNNCQYLVVHESHLSYHILQSEHLYNLSDTIRLFDTAVFDVRLVDILYSVGLLANHVNISLE